MSTQRRCNRVQVDVLHQRKYVLASVTAGVLAAMVGSRSARAASANWVAAPTNGIWEATTGETNWSTGVGTFPGTTTTGSITNTDVATFNLVSSVTSINLNATTPNSLPLNLGAIGFTGNTISSYTIGSTTGNGLVMTSNTSQTSTTNQIFISGSGRGAPTSAVTETINSPIVIAPQSSTTAGFYVFQNASNSVGNGDVLIINGAVSGGTSSAPDTLTLRGANANNNAVNGVISDGGSTGGLALFKSDAGSWTLSGNDTFTGPITINNGTLRFTGNYSGGGSVTFTGSTAGTLLIQTAGTVRVGAIGLNQANALVNVTSGTLIAGQIGENAASSSRQVTLNGGILDLTADYGAIPGPLNLNGGTLANDKSGSATLTIDSFLTNSGTVHNVNVQAGGGTFDTTLGNITSLALLNGVSGGAVNIVGGNTFTAGATSSANTFSISIQGTSTWDYNGAASFVAGLSGSGNITNSGAAASLTSNITTGTQTFSGAIGGGANVSFIKSGAGTQVLSGTSSFTGATSVNAGLLAVTGSMTGSAVTINSGGVLGGNGNGSSTGAYGNVAIATGGLLQPGTVNADGSIGTVTMANLDATNGGSGSTGGVRFDLVSPGASDLINVTGTATFSSSNTFTLVGTPSAGTYTLVSARTLAGSMPTVIVPTGTRETFTPHYGDVTPNAFTLDVTGNAANLTWTGASSNVWDVGSAFNWNNGTGSDQFFNLDTITFTNGAANENITLNQTVQPTAMTVNNDASNPYTISGSGSITGVNTPLTKQGVGTLVLATNNTYGGNTTISGGVLQVGNGGTVGSLGTGNVTDNASLVFNRSDSLTVSNAINGTGALEQKAGTLIITSSNGYTGSTIIDSGATLQLGNGGTTGNLGATSDVTDNGTLIYNRTNAGSLAAPISGTGSLQVTAGTLSLGANNTYSGTTMIATGATLQVGSGGTTGSVGTGALTNNGTLAFNRSDTLSAPSLSGSGGLQQNGTGTLLLTAAGSYTGATTISNGTLAGLDPNAFGNTPAITISAVNGTVSFRHDTSATFARPIDSVPYTVIMNSTGGSIDVNQATVAGTAAKTMTIGNIDASTSTQATLNLNLSGANNTGLTAGTFLGPVSTSGGTVNVNNNNNSGTTTLASYQSNNTSGNDTLTFQGAGNTIITGGIFFGPTDVNVVANGPGNLTILGASNYTLNTTITNGTVAIGDDNSFGQSAVNLNAPDPAVGVLESADSNTRTINNPITNSSTNFTFAGTGNLIFNGNWAKGQFPKNLIVATPITVTIDGVVSNAPGVNGAFSKSGPGTLVLTNDNSYDCPTILTAGTLVAANPSGSATGTGANGDVTLNGGTLASGPVGTGFIAGNVVAGSGAHIIAPGGIGSIGNFSIGGLTSSNLTTLNFDVGTGTGVVTDGDLLTLGSGTVNVGSGTAISVGGTTVIGNDYRLIGGSISGISLGNFVLLGAPAGQGYSLDTSVDPGFIDLVVGVATGPQNLVWSGGTAAWDAGSSSNWNSNGAKFNQGDIVSFDNTNAGSNTVTINTTVQPSGTVTVSGSHAYIFNGTGGIANATSGPATALTQTGSGSLNISTVNTYTGATTIGTGSDTPTFTLASTGKIASASVAVGSGATANINGLLTGAPAVTVGGTATLGAADGINGPSGSILNRTWSTLNVSGNLTVASAPTHAGRTVLVLTSASANPLTNTGKIDLTNNDMIVQHGNTGSIASQVEAGFNAGSGYWNGASGIVSSTAASDTRFLTTLGYRPSDGSTFDGVSTTSGSDVLVKYTYYGDANLDGGVNGADYQQIDMGFGSGATGWFNGDFNYDGVINGSDFALIDNTFNQITATGAISLTVIASPANLIASPAVSAVPEPATLGLLGVGAMGLLGRRKRKCEIRNEMSV